MARALTRGAPCDERFCDRHCRGGRGRPVRRPGGGQAGSPDQDQDGSWIGDRIYSPPSPIAAQSPVTTGPGTFIVKVKNRGTKTDTIHFDAFVTAENGGVQIFYKDTDVSDQIENGQFALKRMAPGESSKAFTLLQTLSPSPGAYVESTLSVWSTKRPANVDSVRMLSLNL